jgi:putative sterol carrier protein
VAVTVAFLSPEWAQALKEALNGSETFRAAAGTSAATIQQVITGKDEHRYWIKIADGAVDLGDGDVADPDATITQSYDTAVALATGQLSAVTAFMTGKIKIGGNMGLLLSLQGVLTQLPAAMATIETQY